MHNNGKTKGKKDAIQLFYIEYIEEFVLNPLDLPSDVESFKDVKKLNTPLFPLP